MMIAIGGQAAVATTPVPILVPTRTLTKAALDLAQVQILDQEINQMIAAGQVADLILVVIVVQDLKATEAMKIQMILNLELLRIEKTRRKRRLRVKV